MTAVSEFNDFEALAALTPQWRNLARQTPGASFFQTPDWLASYGRHFGAADRPRVLVVGDEADPTGILPLVVRRRGPRGAPLRVLTFPLDHWGSFYGPIGPQPAATLVAGLRHLRHTPRDWDLIELAWIDEHAVEATQAAFRAAGLAATAEPRETTALVDLKRAGGWDAYWASRTSRWRNNVRRSQKSVARLGQISYVRYRPQGTPAADDDPRWDLYDDCERIALASWQGSSHSGTTLTHEAIRPFLRDAHRAAAAAGGLDLNLLCIDGRGVAFNYAYRLEGHVFGLRTGFDTAVGQGAGTALQALMIEDSFARGDHTYDLGPGYLGCKRYWQTETRSSYRVTHFALSPAAQLVRAKRSVDRWLGRPRPLPTGK